MVFLLRVLGWGRRLGCLLVCGNPYVIMKCNDRRIYDARPEKCPASTAYPQRAFPGSNQSNSAPRHLLLSDTTVKAAILAAIAKLKAAGTITSHDESRRVDDEDERPGSPQDRRGRSPQNRPKTAPGPPNSQPSPTTARTNCACPQRRSRSGFIEG